MEFGEYSMYFERAIFSIVKTNSFKLFILKRNCRDRMFELMYKN